MEEVKSKKNILWLGILVFISAIIVLSASMFITKNKDSKAEKSEHYKAIFLLNNQVYFGKIKSQTDKRITLENVYYLQVNQAESTTKEGSIKAESQPQISLIKLGEEMHGPKNILEINYQNVMMIEELRPDSKVIEAINSYEKK